MKTIGFLGAGQMALALARGWQQAGVLDTTSSRACDVVAAARDRFRDATGIPTVQTPAEVVAACSVIVIAVKPNAMHALLQEIAPRLTVEHLVISIAAGVTLKQIGAELGTDRRTIRVMPNTPCLVGASASGFSANPAALPEDVALVADLFGRVGKAFALPESQLDAVTGLSGSGPAFIYMLIEALSDGGVKMGLARDVATMLAAQTVFGSAKMVLETGKHPGELKDAVASPGGTTIAGIHALERGAFRAAIMNAVEAATIRAKELGQ